MQIPLLYFTIVCLAFASTTTASQVSKATGSQLQITFNNTEGNTHATEPSTEENKQWIGVGHERRGSNAEPNLVKKPNPHSGTTGLPVALAHVISYLWILVNITYLLA